MATELKMDVTAALARLDQVKAQLLTIIALADEASSKVERLRGLLGERLPAGGPRPDAGATERSDMDK